MNHVKNVLKIFKVDNSHSMWFIGKMNYCLKLSKMAAFMIGIALMLGKSSELHAKWDCWPTSKEAMDSCQGDPLACAIFKHYDEEQQEHIDRAKECYMDFLYHSMESGLEFPNPIGMYQEGKEAVNSILEGSKEYNAAQDPWPYGK